MEIVEQYLLWHHNVTLIWVYDLNKCSEWIDMGIQLCTFQMNLNKPMQIDSEILALTSHHTVKHIYCFVLF